MRRDWTAWLIVALLVADLVLGLYAAFRPLTVVSIDALVRAQSDVTRTKDITNAVLDARLQQAAAEVERLRAELDRARKGGK